jgi:hypothetical protein
MSDDKFVFLSRKHWGCVSFSFGLKKVVRVKANGLVDLAYRTSAADQQVSWAQFYEKRMRRFNLTIISVALVAITWLSVVLWHTLK